jgi:hypothetical protein
MYDLMSRLDPRSTIDISHVERYLPKYSLHPAVIGYFDVTNKLLHG